MARIQREIRITDGVTEQMCYRCRAWKPMDADHFPVDKRIPLGLSSVCISCVAKREREKPSKVDLRSHARRPKHDFYRMLKVPGYAPLQYRDLARKVISEMLKQGWMPQGTMLMDSKGRQYIVRHNGTGQKLKKLPKDQWHDRSAPNVRIK